MDILPYHFKVCKMFGMWYENRSFRIVKMIGRYFVLFVTSLFNLTQIIELITMVGDVKEMADNLFITFTFTSYLLKTYNFVLRYNEMCDLLQDFRSPLCQPKTAEEETILQNHRKKFTKLFLVLVSVSLSTGLFMLSVPLIIFHDGINRLPFKVYLPYDISNPIYYWISYSVEYFSGAVGIILNVTLDTMAFAFIMLATGQYEINCSRHINSTTSIKERIEHHALLQDIVDKIQHFFIGVIVPFFFFSLITLCISVFQMSQMNIVSIEFLSMILYLNLMLSHVFFYCWFGNELELKSKDVIDAVYSSDWLDLNTKERKNLWFTILSVQSSTSISFMGQCSLSVDTFIWIVKTSYGAFSLLKQTYEAPK